MKNATGFDEDELKKILLTVSREVDQELREQVFIGGKFKFVDRMNILRDSIVKKLQVYADLGSFRVDPEDVKIIDSGSTSLQVNIVGETANRFLGVK